MADGRSSSVAPARIPNAVILHGPGRSGTTLLNRILSLHPSLGWISGWIDRLPSRPELAFGHRLMDVPAIERWSRERRRWPRSAEAYGFWNHYFPGFSAAPRGGARADDRPEDCRRAIAAILHWSGKERFVTKLTGAPRDAELQEVFERPFIVWIDRDPRAVVASYLKQRWGYKHRPEQFAATPRQAVLAEGAERYLSSWRGRQRLAALAGERFLDVDYEDLVADPAAFFRRLLAGLSLPASQRFDRLLQGWTIHTGTNAAWRQQLEADDIDFLDQALAEQLSERRL
ncbi:MAG: sulfotransferase [Acidobacteriota bacterium]